MCSVENLVLICPSSGGEECCVTAAKFCYFCLCKTLGKTCIFMTLLEKHWVSHNSVLQQITLFFKRVFKQKFFYVTDLVDTWHSGAFHWGIVDCELTGLFTRPQRQNVESWWKPECKASWGFLFLYENCLGTLPKTSWLWLEILTYVEKVCSWLLCAEHYTEHWGRQQLALCSLHFFPNTVKKKEVQEI